MYSLLDLFPGKKKRRLKLKYYLLDTAEKQESSLLKMNEFVILNLEN